MGDDSEDAEERRRKFEAEQAAKNLGVAIGLAAGMVIAGMTHGEESPEKAKQNMILGGM